jgi:quinoprotein dehydrogenase-associated probable ABC transporter substrate-binding protein
MHGLSAPVRTAAASGLILAAVGSAAAQAPGLGGAGELVDPHNFRVCSDPNDLPFSDQAGEGFENKIAELLSGQLNEPVTYSYFPQVIGFVRVTLNALRCDVIMGMAVGTDVVQTTVPYYHTTYALVFRPGTTLDSVTALSDPRLKGKRIGVVAGTPPATVMTEEGLMAMAKPYALTVDTRVEAPSKSMAEDVAAGRIDAGVLWGPFAGYYATRVAPHLTVVPLLHEKERMDFLVAMGVRQTDQNWKRTLNQLITENQRKINTILRNYGVPLLDDQANLLTP